MIFMDLHEAVLLFGPVGLTTHWEDGTLQILNSVDASSSDISCFHCFLELDLEALTVRE